MPKLRPETKNTTINSILNGNKQWQRKHSAAFFSQHSLGQKPEALFISCSDSRVTPSEISQSSIGKLFEFRNVANLTLAKDQSLQAVVRYAVSHLKIQHIIICGHYGCGGIKAAINIAEKNTPVETELSNWLKPIVTLYQDNKIILSEIKDSAQRYKRLVELNVNAQVSNLENIPFIKNIKHSNEKEIPIIQGAVYDLATGELKILNNAPPAISASKLKENIELQVLRLQQLSISKNPFLRIGAQEKYLAIQSAMQTLNHLTLPAAYEETDSTLYQALNKKRTLPFSFISIKQGSFFSSKSQTILSLQSTDENEETIPCGY
tara:strand:- start:1524 stop:2486 length:963 start_codon:yes stop_codon:yes gene_type:complete